jgi:hypothetical protein
MIKALKRQKMIDEIRASQPAAPEKSDAEKFADLANSARANFEDFAPLQGVRDRMSAGVDALVGQVGDTFGEDSGKSLGDHYDESLKATVAKRAADKNRSDAGKIAGAGLGLASNFLLPTPATKAGMLTNAGIAGVDAATNGAQDVLSTDAALDFTKGAALAGVIDGGLRLGGKVLSKTPAAITGVSDDTAAYYLKNADAVDAARPLKDVSDDLSTAAKQFRREMSNQSTEGFEALKKSGLSATASQLTDPIEEQISRTGANAVTGPAKATVSELTNLRDEIAGIAQSSDSAVGATPLDKVKSFVKQIDDLIDWDAVDRGRASSRDKALLTIRRRYDDMLKSSGDYKKVMEGLSTKASALDDVSGALKSDKSTDNFLSRLSKGKDARGAEALQTLDEQMGTNFSKEVQDAGVKDFFTRENSRGTRNSLVSGAVGALAGSLIGVPPWISGAIGVTAGPAVDKFGRQAYQSVLRAAAKNPELIAKYSKVINTAAQSGPAALIATHQMLKRQDPDYAAAAGDE